MDINEVVRIAMLVLNFVVSNWETIALLPLVVYYIRNKMWDKLFALAVKEGMKFKDVDKTVRNKLFLANFIIKKNWRKSPK
jgi:hypothetical protein